MVEICGCMQSRKSATQRLKSSTHLRGAYLIKKKTQIVVLTFDSQFVKFYHRVRKKTRIW